MYLQDLTNFKVTAALRIDFRNKNMAVYLERGGIKYLCYMYDNGRITLPVRLNEQSI